MGEQDILALAWIDEKIVESRGLKLTCITKYRFCFPKVQFPIMPLHREYLLTHIHDNTLAVGLLLLAEEEIRLVFGKAYYLVKERYPNLLGDYEVEMVNDIPWIKTSHRKV